jgi:hypothetical protein
MMVRFKLTIVLAIVATTLISAGSTGAASINLALRYSGSLAPDGSTSIGTPLLNVPPTYVPGAYHAFEVLMTLSDMTTAQDFQAVQFDINLDGFTPADFGAWIGDIPIFDPPGPPPGVPIFANNSDGGENTNDLKRIAVFATSPGGVKGLRPGEANGNLRFPFPLGTAYLEWDGMFDDGSIGLNVTPNGALPWGIYDGITPIALDASQFTTIGGSITFTPIPEPATIMLIGVAMFGVVGYRSRNQ